MLVCVVGVLDMEMAYPLVNMQKNCGKAPCFMAKSTINGQFSIVTSKCRRVYPLVDNFFYFVWPIFRWCLCSKPCLFTSWMGVLKTTSNDLTPNSFWNWWFRSKRNHGPKHKRDSHWMFHGCSMEIPPEMPPHSMDLWGQAQRNCQIYGVGSQDGSSHSAMERWLYKLIIGTCSVICDLYVHI